MTRATPLWFGRLLVSAVIGLPSLTGCLTPYDDGRDLYSSYIMPSSATVPEFEGDKAAAKKLDANDGLNGTLIQLHGGFAGGNEVQYWDLGTLTSASAKPMWIFRKRVDDDGPAKEVHPNLIDSIPGDSSYTPLRQLYVVFVTSAYRGEHITSLRALEDAQEIGLIEAPVAQDRFVNCAVTLSSVQLQTSFDEGGVQDPEPAYYQGRVVYQHCIGGFYDMVGAFMLNNGSFSPGNAYVLRRQNETQPIDEAALKTKLNDDEDMLDSNTVFDSTVGDMNYTSVWKSIDVVVPPTYMYPDSTSEADLFVRKGSLLSGKPDKVIEYNDSGVFLNRPILQVQP